MWDPGYLYQDWMLQWNPVVFQGHDVGYGVIPLSGWIDVIVDNHDPRPENEKWIRIQLTWINQPGGNGLPPTVTVEDLLNGGPFDVPSIGNIPLGMGWTHTTYEIILPQNPVDEWVYIDGDVFVDELVIDTWCIPEPGSMALIGIGLLALLKRK